MTIGDRNQVTDGLGELLDGAEPLWLLSALQQVSKLTRQQLNLLRCLASGMDNRTIAKTMRCSDRTVKLHATEAVRRLGVSARLQAALVGHHLILSRAMDLPENSISISKPSRNDNADLYMPRKAICDPATPY